MFPLYDENQRRGKIPIMTMVLVVFNVFFFILSFTDPEFFFKTFAFSFDNLFNGRLYTIFTSLFLHRDIVHLLGNVWFLWVFGENLESRMGSLKFLFFYFLCGTAAVLAYALTEDKTSFLIGASGAISGIMGAYLVLFPGNKIRAVVPLVFFWTTVSVSAFVFLIIWFLIQIFSLGLSDMVAYSSHVGGFLFGMLAIKSFVKKR
ncbi:MAG: rhomboid family intramembrane serine protease [Candidatus Pacebacteria bacterium]|nr:rhomboid family intramembrane serine protease [Candidatus Paceibacterota bacterium]